MRDTVNMLPWAMQVAGFWTSDDAMAAALVQASRDAGEKVWRMPLEEAYWEGGALPFLARPRVMPPSLERYAVSDPASLVYSYSFKFSADLRTMQHTLPDPFVCSRMSHAGAVQSLIRERSRSPGCPCHCHQSKLPG